MCGWLNSGGVECWILGVQMAEFWVCGLLDTGCADGCMLGVMADSVIKCWLCG